ncbi:MAG: hypothetical protein FJ148_20435 [Deltaproteobacteria bacterium]|nr:hypothetical protein [Deltaproteobacteria bacterium]
MSFFQSEFERVAGELQTLHGEYRRIARQLEAHVEEAPYPHVADRLRKIVDQEEQNARRIADRLVGLGRHLRDEDAGPIRGGHNAWERLVVTLEDYRGLLRRLSGLWTRWDDEHPEDAALVHELRDSAVAHREEIVDLMARSDPHAEN